VAGITPAIALTKGGTQGRPTFTKRYRKCFIIIETIIKLNDQDHETCSNNIIDPFFLQQPLHQIADVGWIG
jgi:hypothetical protein